MKFLCDRCKTRYSIADERVRGKILKVRCKNCSNVITVREGMPEPEAEPAVARRVVQPTVNLPAIGAPKPPGRSPLERAFAQEMQQGAAAPSQLEDEWFVSIDGAQAGPFDLAAAQAWVKGKRASDELFCWCEGFDDWLPVDKVSHFRGLRAPPRPAPPRPAPRAAPRAAPAIPTSAGDDDEPRPLFAATLAALERKAETLPPPGFDHSESDLAGAPAAEAPINGHRERAPSGADPAEDELAIGEVSRVIRLADVAAAARPVAARAPTAAPVARGTAAIAALAEPAAPRRSASDPGSAGQLAPMARLPRRRASTALIAIGGGTVVALGAMIVVFATSGSGGDRDVSRRRSGGLQDLAVTVEVPRATPREVTPQPVEPDPPSPTTRKPAGGGPRTATPTSKTGGTSATAGSGAGTGRTEASIGTDGQPLTPLTADDVIAVAQRMATGYQRCYSRALKDNQWLDVKSVGALLAINADGKVTEVVLDSQQSTKLGECLVAAIKRWPFRRSTAGLDTKITLKFQQGGM
jgi:predicted Zn finger-like uncharacterized protein